MHTYTLLRALTGNGESFELRTAQDWLRPFRLAAFVLHDPMEDVRFHRLIDQEFSRLDDETGDHFLFFAFAQPSESWHRRRRNEGHYHLTRGSDLPTLMADDVGLVSNAIASATGISLDGLPALIVLNPSDFSLLDVFSTGPEIIEQQLLDLARISAGRVPSGPEVRHLGWERVDHVGGGEDFSGSLFSALSAAHAGAGAALSGSDGWSSKWIVEEASKAAIRALEEWQESLGRARARISFSGEDPHSADELFSKALPLLISFAAYVGDVPSRQLVSDSAIQMMERGSRGSMRAFSRVKAVLADPKEFDLVDELDCAPAAICLGRVLETELNASVVQWVRQLLGAAMPQYFCRLVPGRRMNVPGFQGREPIDLNKGNNSKLFKKTIGEIVAVCRWLGLELRIPPVWNVDGWSRITDEFEQIRKVRNQGAHSEPVSYEDIRTIESCFQRLDREGDLIHLLEMKMCLRGPIA